ncbi:family 47 glycoside hydrolase [Phakopsora pachyrhizi]|uniref:alpha-1,2-Mannosidase n=1 Tax=Phakopsora pachyrhizi TaxID=170000 RepID=A0AAV0AUK6_PHAPC|nr:family 47 glycoside hydrolase [Phakopsora pachyrhizi]
MRWKSIDEPDHRYPNGSVQEDGKTLTTINRSLQWWTFETRGCRRKRERSKKSTGWTNLLFIVLIFCGIILSENMSLAVMSRQRKLELRNLVRETWDHGFKSYMDNAFPDDELRPISCKGVSYDYDNINNREINDVMGDFIMTLIDTLDTFVIFRDHRNFSLGLRKVIDHLANFDLDVNIQVFETTIRVMGGLLSCHLFAKGQRGFRFEAVDGYGDELLFLAEDLGRRLLPAFQNSKTGIPFARVNLRYGVVYPEETETCTAGAGSLLLEFATLSRLLNKPIYEEVAKRAFYALWNRRSLINLLGNTINVQSGFWSYGVSTIGAGVDSFYEYVLKSHILLQDDSFLEIWDKVYESTMRYMRSTDGFIYHSVNMQTGSPAHNSIDSLAAFWPGLMVLAGDIESAIKSHMIYANLWKRYSALPEVFDTYRKTPNVLVYPQRPEFIESNYFLYRATKDEFYLEMAERVILDLVDRMWVDCGLASLNDIVTGDLDDRMHSFMLSETLKYLYLTFDEDNPINTSDESFIFSTEAHILLIPNSTQSTKSQKSYYTQYNIFKESNQNSTSSDSGKIESEPKNQRKCSAFLPSTKDQMYLSDLKLTVQGRTDFECAKMLVGFEDNIFRRGGLNLTHDGWFNFGFSQVPVLDVRPSYALFLSPFSCF